jgi:hypothetical protein
MSEQERKTFEEGDEQPAREETIRDLDVPEESADAVKGGVQDPENKKR